MLRRDQSPRSALKPRVSVVGFSANPPTDDTGHGGMIKHLVESTEYDEIWLLPVYKHMFDSKSNLLTFEHRLAMCDLVATRLTTDKVLVVAKDLEKVVYLNAHNKQLTAEATQEDQEAFTSNFRVGTIDIINYIKEYYKNHTLVSINLGTDTFEDLVNGKWKMHEEILKGVYINVFARDKAPPSLELVPAYAKGVNQINLESLGKTSSSMVRESRINFDQWWCSYTQIVEAHKKLAPVYGEVYDYIRQERLYFYSPDVSFYLRCRYFIEDFWPRRQSKNNSPAVVTIGAVVLSLILAVLFSFRI